MLPIKMMKVDPIARISGMAAEFAKPQTRLRKAEETRIEHAEGKTKADQHDQRPELGEPASAEPPLKEAARSGLICSGAGSATVGVD